MANVHSRSGETLSVEPLSDAAWSRVEAGLFARLDRGEHRVPAEPLAESAPATTRRRARPAPRRWGFVLAFAAAAAAAAVWVQTSTTSTPRESTARVEAQRHASGPVEATAPLPAALGQLAGGVEHVADGAHLATGAEPKRWRVGDSEVTLAAGSELAVAGSDAVGFRLTLEHGRVDCEVAPRAGRPAFLVEAGEATVTVIGTRFSVSRDVAAGRVEVQVEHGSVRVSTPEASVLLGAGQSWPAPDAAPVASQRPATRALDTPSPTRRGADAAARFDRATRLEATSPDAALRIYRDLSQKAGPWAPNALYAAGRLEVERHRMQRGRALLERYLKRYPQGANAADARELLERR